MNINTAEHRTSFTDNWIIESIGNLHSLPPWLQRLMELYKHRKSSLAWRNFCVLEFFMSKICIPTLYTCRKIALNIVERKAFVLVFINACTCTFEIHRLYAKFCTILNFHIHTITLSYCLWCNAFVAWCRFLARESIMGKREFLLANSPPIAVRISSLTLTLQIQ